MNKYLKIIAISLTLIGCSNNKIEYYESDNIKSIKYLNQEKQVDSIVDFYDHKDGFVKARKIINQNNSKYTSYYLGNKIKQTGNLSINGLKEGYWISYNENGKQTQKSEYLIIDDTEHINRDFRFNASGDTIASKGNFYKIKIINDSIENNNFRFYFIIQEPLFSYTSKQVLYVQKNKELILDDYSSLSKVALDTVQSLEYDGIDHSHLPGDLPLNRMILFDVEYKKAGKKTLKGYISEYNFLDANDSTKFEERKLYFSKDIYVKETVK